MPEKNTTAENDTARLHYEAAFHLLPILSDTEQSDAASRVRTLIESAGGVVVSEERPKHFSLSYTIKKRTPDGWKKFDTSFFGFLIFDASPAVATTLNEALTNDEAVLRHLVIKREPEAPASAPRSILGRPAKRTVQPVVPQEAEEKETAVSSEDLDKEIERLVVE